MPGIFNLQIFLNSFFINTFYPYRKENSKIIYLNSNSNHPPSKLKHISKMTIDRLSNNSSNEDFFNKIRKDYNDAIKLSGYNKREEKKRSRNRKNNKV